MQLIFIAHFINVYHLYPQLFIMRYLSSILFPACCRWVRPFSAINNCVFRLF